jgi:hypothetical protein
LNLPHNLQRCAQLCDHPVFSTIYSNIAGQAGATSRTDTNCGTGPFFYRVGVQ